MSLSLIWGRLWRRYCLGRHLKCMHKSELQVLSLISLAVHSSDNDIPLQTNSIPDSKALQEIRTMKTWGDMCDLDENEMILIEERRLLRL